MKTVAIRHPMPYGDLSRQAVQRFATYDDLDRHNCTIEEREEYEPHLDQGSVVYAGVDYEAILRQAEGEADVVVWDGGNNDFSFYRPDLDIVVVDALRAGHETDYFPGEVNFRRADVLIISKCGSAQPGAVDGIRERAARYNPQAVLVGRLNRSPSGGWSSRWHLEVAGRPSAWSDSSQQLDTLSQQGIDDTADLLASRFAVARGGGNANTVSISVSGVDSLNDYARLSAYLKGLTAVVDVQARRVAGAEIDYALQLNGSIDDLTRTVSIGTVLEPIISETPGQFRLRQ